MSTTKLHGAWGQGMPGLAGVFSSISVSSFLASRGGDSSHARLGSAAVEERRNEYYKVVAWGQVRACMVLQEWFPPYLFPHS